MENEIMYEEALTPEVDITEMATENSKMSLGKAMLIGAGVIAATTAVVKLGKKLYVKIKAKKEEREPAEVEPEEDEAIDE